MEWYLKVVRDNYANFVGRARRQEYWMFTLFNLIAYVVLVVVGRMLFGKGFMGDIPSAIYSLALLIPSIAVSIRRLHDTDRSGWWLLLAFIPLANIALLVFMCFEGTRGSNRFGNDPKAQISHQ